MSSQLPSLDLLRVFEACGRLLSFTAAAAELGTTQPAISQQVQRLEKQLSTRLFDREQIEKNIIRRLAELEQKV